MKYNTKEIKVKEIINLIGNLEADIEYLLKT